MSLGIRLFIGLIFTAIGLSFLATTGVLIWEFRELDWLMLGSFYSHLFIFFPTFGIVALIAFFMPACVFLDMYMRHVRWGVPRFMLGFVIAVGLSILGANFLMNSRERSVFEVKPEVLAADRGEQCAKDGNCARLPVLVAVDNVRRVSQSRIGLSDLARDCRPDVLKETPLADAARKRYCFVATRLPANIANLKSQDWLTDEACCTAQRRFTQAVKAMHDAPGGRSLTSVVHATLLPFKIFFAVILLVISVLLAVRRKALEKHYPHMLDGIERGVLIGAGAMVIYPIMSHAFLQSAALLYYGTGPSGGFRSTAPLISFGLGAWGLLLLFFFYGRRNQEIQNLARMGGVIGSAVAIVKYDQIIDYFVRIFGSGAGFISLGVLAALALGALLLLFRTTWQELDEADAIEASEMAEEKAG